MDNDNRRLDDAYHAGRTGALFNARSYSEALAHEQGKESAQPGPPGIRVHLFAIIFFSVVFLGYWPVSGAIATCAGLAVGYGLHAILPADPRWILLCVGAGVAVGIAGLILGRRIERRAELVAPYRIARHVFRILWVGFLLTVLALESPFSRGSHEWPDRITWTWLDSRLTPLLMIGIVVGMAVTHFMSRTGDRHIESAVDPERAARKSGQRVDRFRGMRVAFLVCAPLGIVAALVHGDPFFGSIVAGVVIGVACAGFYFVYRLVRDSFA